MREIGHSEFFPVEKRKRDNGVNSGDLQLVVVFAFCLSFTIPVRSCFFKREGALFLRNCAELQQGGKDVIGCAYVN
jgi:hypothetical protein